MELHGTLRALVTKKARTVKATPAAVGAMLASHDKTGEHAAAAAAGDDYHGGDDAPHRCVFASAPTSALLPSLSAHHPP